MQPYTLPDSVLLREELTEASATLRRTTQCLAMAKEQQLLTQSNELLSLVDEAELLFKTSTTLVQQLRRRYKDS